MFALGDAAVVLACAILGGAAYQFAVNNGIGDLGIHTGFGIVASVTFAGTGHRLGIYRIDTLVARGHDDQRIWVSWALAVLMLTVALFLFKIGEQVSRGSAVTFALLGGVSLVLWRRLAKQWLGSALIAGAIRGRRVILIGTSSELSRFSARDLLLMFGMDETERVTLPADGEVGRNVHLRQKAIECALEQARSTAADEVVLALPWSDIQKIELLLGRLRVMPLPVRLLPDRALSHVLGQLGPGHNAYVVEVNRAPLTPLERAAKRAVDVAVAAAALVLLSPVMLVSAVAIRLGSSGPVIFRQRRRGFNGKTFVIYKFRTMRVLEDGPAVVQAVRSDPRVTGIGRFLRQSSIDELPQLFNVLRGDMSLVGPRPHALAHDDEYGQVIADYAFRHHVKPGITGWAQVEGFRGGTPRLELMEERIRRDLWYINNWSMALDLRIMLRTAFELLRPRAY